MLTSRAKYALRALIVLAASREAAPLPTPAIAEQAAVPPRFLEQILAQLRHAGLVASRRGRAGGYVLARHATRISFGEIIRLMDGPIAPLPCLSVTAYRACDDCTDEANCVIRQTFHAVAAASRSVLDHKTIADAVTDQARLSGVDEGFGG